MASEWICKFQQYSYWTEKVLNVVAATPVYFIWSLLHIDIVNFNSSVIGKIKCSVLLLLAQYILFIWSLLHIDIQDILC